MTIPVLVLHKSFVDVPFAYSVTGLHPTIDEVVKLVG